MTPICKYWMSLASKGVTYAQSQADIILVGSYADVLKSRKLEAKRDLLVSVWDLPPTFDKFTGCWMHGLTWTAANLYLLEWPNYANCLSCRSARYRVDYNSTNAFLLLSESYMNRRKLALSVNILMHFYRMKQNFSILWRNQPDWKPEHK